MTYCSKKVDSLELKQFTCPIDNSKCPNGKDAVLDVTSLDTVVTRSKTWNQLHFRELSNCKYNIKYSGNVKSESTHFYNLEIKIEEFDNIQKASIIQIPFSGIFDNTATA